MDEGELEMELALICAQQVIVLFLLIGAGAAAIKTGVLKAEGRQTLSNLLVYLVVPAMIIHSYMMEFSEEILHNLLAAFGLSVLAILIGTVLTLALTAKQKDRRAPIFRFACVFSNAAYMGFPLISALFGSEGLLYASAYVTVFNILLWTMGYGMVSGSSSPKEVAKSLLRTPVLYAMVAGLAIYLLQIPVPALIAQPLELLSNMNTPLSMLITGILIATGDLKQIVCDRHIWKLAAVRMLLIPAVCLAAFAVLGLLRFGMSAQVVLLLECCPAAAITSVFAVQFGHDEQFAAGCVVLTTLLSIVTLPLCAFRCAKPPSPRELARRSRDGGRKGSSLFIILHQRHDVFRRYPEVGRGLRRRGGKGRFGHLPPQLACIVRSGTDHVPVKGVFTGSAHLNRHPVFAVHRFGGKVVGADAHGAAPFRHRQGHGQLPLPAGQTDMVFVHPDAGQDVLAAGQPSGGQAAGVGENFLRRARTQHLAAVHDDHLAAEAVGFVPVMGHQQGRAVKVGEQTSHFALHFLAQVAVQRTERLVQHQDAGSARQDAGQRGTLLLPA